MARYKYIDTQPQLIPVELSHFDARLQNDATGAPAYPLALLKVVLFGIRRAS